MTINFTEIMSKRTDEELLKIVTEQRKNYQSEAVEAAEKEIANRGGLEELKQRYSNVSETVSVKAEDVPPAKPKVKMNPYLKWGIILVVFLLLTLPFHYVPSQMRMFPKDNFTFSNTLIFQSDVDELISKYNKVSLFEKMTVLNEPLFKKLKEKGIIIFQDEPTQPNSENGNINESNDTSANTQPEIQYSDEDKEILSKTKDKIKRDYPNDFTTQKMLYDQQITDYFYMKTVSDAEIKSKMEREYPFDFSTQKMLYNMEIEAKEQMK